MDLGISTNPTPELYTIKVTGEIDISNADSLRNAIDLALEQPTEAVELDFAQVSYIDSTGIGVWAPRTTRSTTASALAAPMCSPR